MRPLAPRTVFLVLTGTRWAPVGLVVGVFTLWARERGLSVAETLTYVSFQGLAVLLLELPSSGLADALGRGHSALLLPLVLYALLCVVHLVATSALLRETRAEDAPPGGTGSGGLAALVASARATPRVIGDSVRLVVGNRVLSSLAGRLHQRIGVPRTAIVARVLNGLGALAMGLAAGPVALVAAYLFTYALHGTAGVAHNALLHREATSGNRATVLSLNSLVFCAAAAAWSPVLGLLASRTSTATAMALGGLVSVLGLLGYLPAARADRRRSAARVRDQC
ncbi:hypothetical protein GGG17_00415 [Arsenicicoccus sp. MKL-02]|uniref:MFS transporter n=1 Tax=Arsenicicoccus cauae TaxID=2663847 RepID=A0A6I3IUH1_9MICO|nr:hypothetical protein [Arsenicicoccus cauae]MTB70466.1 hypothetical protein [Arsenicicoccus cauae]